MAAIFFFLKVVVGAIYMGNEFEFVQFGIECV
jgi:hypothetical protein